MVAGALTSDDTFDLFLLGLSHEPVVLPLLSKPLCHLAYWISKIQ